MANEPDLLLSLLQADPDDDALRERTARALLSEGRGGEALATLFPRWRNLNAHDAAAPRCCCRACITPDDVPLEYEGLTLHRDFVVARSRVLWFLRPAELDPEAAAVREWVRRSLDARLAREKTPPPGAAGDEDMEDEGDD